MKSWKKWLSGALCLALLLGLLPITALAAGEAPWAESAVTALNDVYGNDIFSADGTIMTENDLNTLIGATKWKVKDSTQGQAEGELTRGKTCEVLAYAFDLPVTGGSSAIQYLYDQHIINGKDASGTLAENDAVTKAEFAVITYRVLNSVGGGKGSSTALKPGTKEYFALMYLAFRGCVLPLNTDSATLNKKIGEVTFSQNPNTTLGGQDLWNSWAERLNSLKNPTNAENTTQIGNATYSGNDSLIAAAMKMVDAYIAANGSGTIFSDVAPDKWYYDGVMYLADHNIVRGYGDGRFGAEDNLTRVQLATILFNADGQQLSDWSQWETETKEYVTDQNYMIPDNNDPDWWSATSTCEETIVAIMKAQASAAASANTAILDRFTGTNGITEGNKPYIAYAVSLGIVNGTAGGGLDLSGNTTRGMAGVLLYRTLLGADKTKMKDYADDVSYAKGATQTQTFAMRAARTGGNTLTLREDWRLTSNLDLATDEPLTINGNGHHIYEMGGKLTNSGTGAVTFTEGTILYPAKDDADAVKVAVSGTWDTPESDALMLARHPVTPPVPTTYTVTVNGSYSTNPGAGSYAAGANVTVNAGTRSEYSFAGWTADGVTLSSTGSAATSFVMPSNDVTLTANWSYIGGSSSGGSSSSGGGSSSGSSNTTTTTERNPDGSTTTTVTDRTTGTVTETTRNPDGSQTVVETRKDGSRETTVRQADGTTAAVTTGADGQTEAAVSLSDRAVSAAQAEDVAVTLPIPAVTDATPVEISLPRGSGEVKVEIPAEDTAPGTVAVIVAANGEEKVVKKSVATENGVTLTLAEGATVRLVDNSRTFSDVNAAQWHNDAVAFVSARSLFSGVGGGRFAPDGTMTRGMVAVVLHNLEDNPDSAVHGVFDDVPDGAWYMDGVQWAAEQDIISGYGGGRFGPNENVTREQFAAMLWRYSGRPEASQELSFTDADQVSGYALEAMRWAVESGIMGGYGDGRLEPKGQATRAQVAQMLMNFLNGR